MGEGIDAACVNLSDAVNRAINAIRGETRKLEERNEVERAVIEAAKACFASENVYQQDTVCPLPTALHEALCALIAAEGEE